MTIRQPQLFRASSVTQHSEQVCVERTNTLNTAATAEPTQQVAISSRHSSKRFLTVLFLFACTLRWSVMFAGAYYHIDSGDDHFGFGWEMGRVARSLAQGEGFSSPMPMPTGPTAIVGPIYPLLLASIFKLLGIYSTASAVAVLLLQCVFSSLTCLFVYLCGGDTLGEKTGRLAALIWAVFPLNIFFTVTRIWETSITALLTAVLFWCMLPLRHSLSAWRWAVTGALLAVAALINTSLIMLAIPFGISALWANRLRVVRPAAAMVLAFFALVSPWLVRNYLRFGKPILRSNFPLEFRVGNNEWSPGQKLEDLHPAKARYLNQRWHEVGENGFMAEERDLNRRFVAGDTGLFAFSIVNRAVYYWTGAWLMPTLDFPNKWPLIFCTSGLSLVGLLGIRRMFYLGNSSAWLFAGCLLLYPVLYYLTTSQPRFYYSITPLLVVAGASWACTLPLFKAFK